jgi:PAS domain S-box-containing protein
LEMGLESDNVERAGLVTAVEQAADGIVITDIDGRIQYVNPAFSAMTGYSRLEVLGQNPRVLKSGRHPKGFYEGLWGTLRSGQVWHGVLTNRRKDGSLYDEEMRIAPVRNVDGGVSGYIAIKRDVTEQKAAEESRRFLASIVETSDDAIISYSPVGTILTWNQGAEEIFGYRTLEVVGKHVSFLAPSERHSNIAQTLESLLSGELMQLRQGLGLHKDGRKIPVSIRSSVIKSSSGEVIAISDIVRDVSKLQEAEKKYRDIFNGAIEGIFQHELTGKPLAVNPALARTLGYDSPEELVSLVKDVTKDVWLDPDLHAQLSRRADEHGVVRGMECQLKRKDGSVIWASISGHRVHNELGREPYLEGFLEDITERKRGEEALHLSEERYRTVFQMNLDGIAITRLSDGMVVDVNKAFLDLMGYDRGEVFGNTTVGLGMWVDLDDRKNWAEVLLATSAVRDLKVRLKRKNGDVFWSLNSSAVIEIDGASCVLTIVRDVSAAQAAEEEIKSLAFYDTLTGLPNRRQVAPCTGRRHPKPPMGCVAVHRSR